MIAQISTQNRRLVPIVASLLLVSLPGCGSSAPEDALPAAQSAAVKALRELGAKCSIHDGKVTYVDFYSLADANAAVVHLKDLPDVQKLNFSSTNLANEQLVNLAGLADLRELAVNRTQVTDEGLVHLAGLTKLEKLNFNEDNVTDAGLVHLKDLQALQQLHLNQTKVTDAGLAHLEGLEQLVWLGTFETGVTAEGAAAFHQQHPDVEVVVTEGSTNDESAEQAAQSQDAERGGPVE